MGALCSKTSAVDKSPSDTLFNINGVTDPEPMLVTRATPAAQRVEEAMEKYRLERSPSSSERTVQASCSSSASAAVSREPQLPSALLQKSGSIRPRTGPSTKTGTKVSEVSSILGRASTAGLGKAVEVLDTLGSSMTSLNLSSGFVSGVTTKGTQIRILAFEVANTIVKGSNLMRSLSKENIKHLKEVVLTSEGVLHLISKDTNELLKIAATDKREELKVFSKEVVRFGNRCKDPQWHNLDRYFDKLASENTPPIHLKEEAESVMWHLITSVQCTAELYHELHTLDRFEQDYRRKNQEDDGPNIVHRGDNLQILKQELKSQKKHVKSLKKRSLWSKNLEEVMEKLVDIVHFLHFEINDAFGSAERELQNASSNPSGKLGPAGLALHYANIISQIDTLVSRPCSVPQNTRGSLYQALPPKVKSALRYRLQSLETKEEPTVGQIKEEMEKTMRWLLPIANNTTKAHHGFGWVGEWANIGSEVNYKLTTGQVDLLRVETLHHADKDRTEAHILDLVVWLHHLISQSRPANGSVRSPIKSPVRSPTQKGLLGSSTPSKANCSPSVLSQEDQEMLKDVKFRRFVPGISKSQEFDTARRRLSKHGRLSKSNSHSPTSSSGGGKDLVWTRRASMLPVINFDIDRAKAMDMIDRVDDLRKL